MMAFGMAGLLTGCGQGGEEETDSLVIVDQEEQKTQYTLTVASFGDVVLTRKIRCSYQQLVSQDVSFAVGGREITHVYVEQGDTVKKGQLLAELGSDDQDARIKELRYNLSRNQILLDQTELDENYELSTIWLRYMYRTNLADGDDEARDESIAQVQEKYKYLREDYQDAIEMDSMELEQLLQEKAVNGVYAQINGTVSWIRQNLEGATSKVGETIMSLIDNSECFFAATDMEYRDLFEKDVPLDLEIGYGENQGVYQVVPYRMDEWTERMLFAFDQEYGLTIDMGATATLQLVLDERDQVLRIAKGAVHRADGKTFVYCLGDDGMRQVKWVETGMYGDDMVEITAGLEEGEKVILQ